MYNSEDTIVAVSSVDSGPRVILRIGGSRAIEVCRGFFRSRSDVDGRSTAEPDEVSVWGKRAKVLAGSVCVDEQLHVDAYLYVFFAPHSYTGQDIAEVHMLTNRAVLQVLMDKLLGMGLRAAEAGEFTARAYMNGKIDLSQAEAVNEVIVGSNTYQLLAAQRLLSGRLSQATGMIRSQLVDLIALIEAGLDFSEEDIEFISRAEAAKRVRMIRDELGQLLAGSINYESVVEMPSVGIAGAPNAGKSSLINKLLGRQRSIVSATRMTTRDVLTGVVSLEHCDCVMFDCAGLVSELGDILDELAQGAAMEALRNSSLVLFCVDVARAEPDGSGQADLWGEDFELWSIVRGLGLGRIVPVATKADLLTGQALDERLKAINGLFGTDFLATSSQSGLGIEPLRGIIDGRLTGLLEGFESGGRRAMHPEDGFATVGLTARHRHAVSLAIENAAQAVEQLQAGNDEVAVMMLRGVYEDLAEIDRPVAGSLDEQILGEIFGRFCVGK